MFPGAVFEILLHIGWRLAPQMIITVVQKFTNGCPRRARTSGGTVDDRVRGRRRGVAFFNGMDNPDFWYEVSVTWFSRGADRVISDFTPDDDHCVGLMAGASAGPLWRGACGSNDVCDVVPNGSARRFRSMIRGDRFSRVLDEEFSLLEADGSRGGLGAELPGSERTPETLQTWTITWSPSRGSQMGRYEANLVSRSLQLMRILLVCWVTLSMTFSHVSWCPLWLVEDSAETWLSRDVSHFKMLAIVLRRVCMEPMPHTWPVRSIPLTAAPVRPLGLGVRKRTSGIEDACR